MMGYLLLYFLHLLHMFYYGPGHYPLPPFRISPRPNCSSSRYIRNKISHITVMFELYRLLANGRHHNGPNFEFLWHFSRGRTKTKWETSRLNYCDEKCALGNTLLRLAHKYCVRSGCCGERPEREKSHFEIPFKRFRNYENFKNVCILLFSLFIFFWFLCSERGYREACTNTHTRGAEFRRVMECLVYEKCVQNLR